MEYSVVLSIAGSDSSAGAGIQADIKSVAATGGYCATAITALTAQNTMGVNAVSIVSADMLSAQIKAVTEDLNVKAFKLGMLPSEDIVKCVREAICSHGVANVVLDPVMVSTSGDMLVSPAVAEGIIKQLIPLATVVTPNIPECEFITGLKVSQESDFESVAQHFKALGCRALLLKSGHLSSGNIRDYLYDFVLDKQYVFEHERLTTPNTHGTGCSLSSALASYLAQGMELSEAVREAEYFVHQALTHATYKLGAGHGPINHLYHLKPHNH